MSWVNDKYTEIRVTGVSLTKGLFLSSVGTVAEKMCGREEAFLMLILKINSLPI